MPHEAWLTSLWLFVVAYSKQCCLQTNKFDESLRVTDIQDFIPICYFVFELRNLNLNMNKTPYHSTIHQL